MQTAFIFSRFDLAGLSRLHLHDDYAGPFAGPHPTNIWLSYFPAVALVQTFRGKHLHMEVLVM